MDGAWPPALRFAVLLDLIGAAVSINGTSIFYSPLDDLPAEPANLLPAGVNVVARLPYDTSAVNLPAVQALIARGFRRIAVVVSDAMGVEPRTLTTALSASGEGPVAGRIEQDGLYLVGFGVEQRDEGPPAWLGEIDWHGAGITRSMRVRWLEAAPALASVSTKAELIEIVEARLKALPRTRAWLAGESIGEASDAV